MCQLVSPSSNSDPGAAGPFLAYVKPLKSNLSINRCTKLEKTGRLVLDYCTWATGIVTELMIAVC